MPTYEYECQKCGHVFEEFQSMTAKPLTKCPSCKKGRVQRLIGAGAGILFKGSGFYETDYRSESYRQAAKKESDAASPSSGEKKSEGKKEAASAGEPKKAAKAKAGD